MGGGGRSSRPPARCAVRAGVAARGGRACSEGRGTRSSPAAQGRPGRRALGDPRAARRGADARLPDHPGAELARRRRVAAEPGSVYPTLQQLEDEGLVHSDEADGRRVFRLTDEGKAEVGRRDGDQAAPWEVGDESGPFVVDMRKAGFGLVSAVMQVAQTGEPGRGRPGRPPSSTTRASASTRCSPRTRPPPRRNRRRPDAGDFPRTLSRSAPAVRRLGARAETPTEHRAGGGEGDRLLCWSTGAARCPRPRRSRRR